MKKILLLLAALMLAVMQLPAQSTLVATLSHGDSLTAFYGKDALKNAHEAADSCDVITLSSGVFNAVDITKPLTIRGTGIVKDSISDATYIDGQYYLKANNVTLEGLYHNNTVNYQAISNLKCYKCRFDQISSTSSSSPGLTNAAFVNCRFAASATSSSTTRKARPGSTP